MEPNDRDELRGDCPWCSWVGPWRDMIRAAAVDQLAHHEECEHRPDTEEPTTAWPS